MPFSDKKRRAEYNAQYYAENREEIAEQKSGYYQVNRLAILEKKRTTEVSPEVKEQIAIRSARPEEREANRLRTKEWREEFGGREKVAVWRNEIIEMLPAGNKYGDWTPEEIEIAMDTMNRSMGQPRKIKDIALELDRTYDAVVTLRRNERHGRNDGFVKRGVRQEWSEADDDLLMSFVAAGLTHQEIAAEMGCTKASIDCRVSRVQRQMEKSK